MHRRSEKSPCFVVAPKLSYAEKAAAGCDFVAETEADLCRREGHLLAVEVEQPAEVDEQALGGFGPQVPN
jgi:hypothetical protein